MRLAVLADVQGNLPALEAVLRDVEARSVDTTVCLGDVVGPGGRMAECIALVRARVAHIIAGTRDLAVCAPAQSSCLQAEVPARLRSALVPEDLAWLRALPRTVRGEGWMGVHSHLDPALLQTHDPAPSPKALLDGMTARASVPPVVLASHGGSPQVSHRTDGAVAELAIPRLRWPANAEAVLIDPGSVGRRHPSDPRATYAIVDLRARIVESVRVRYGSAPQPSRSEAAHRGAP